MIFQYMLFIFDDDKLIFKVTTANYEWVHRTIKQCCNYIKRYSKLNHHMPFTMYSIYTLTSPNAHKTKQCPKCTFAKRISMQMHLQTTLPVKKKKIK